MYRTGSIGSRVPPAVTRRVPPPSDRPGRARRGRVPRRRQDRSRGGHDVGGVGQPSCTDVAPGQAPARRLDHVHPSPSQQGDVVGHRRVLPHLGVHGRAEQHRRPGGQRAWRSAGPRRSRRRRCRSGGPWPGRPRIRSALLPQPGVRDGLRFVPERGPYRLRRQGREGDGADEAGGAPGSCTGLTKAPASISRRHTSTAL